MSYRTLPRLVVTLLYKEGAFYNSKGFKKYDYLGDPVNIIRLLNDKNCMEATILNLDETKIDYEDLEVIASEAFMPLSYGGLIKSEEEVKRIISLGYEKIVFKDHEKGLELAKKTEAIFGSQSVSICLNYNDFKQTRINLFSIFKSKFEKTIEERIKIITRYKPGEILLQNIQKDGCSCGLDLSILSSLKNVNIPILLSGGCTGYDEIESILESYPWLNFAGTTSYTYRNGGILVNYPSINQIKRLQK